MSTAAGRLSPRPTQRIAEEERIPAHVPAITPAHIYAYLGRVAETGVGTGPGDSAVALDCGQRDRVVRSALEDRGYRVVVIRGDRALDEQVTIHEDVFGQPEASIPKISGA